MSLAPQVEECQQTVDDEIALDSTFLLRKVVHKALDLSCASVVLTGTQSGDQPPRVRRGPTRKDYGNTFVRNK